MKKFVTTLVVLIVLLIIFVMLGPFYVLNEGEQSVVTRFGAIVKSEQDAGLKFKTPMIDTVVKYPKRILSWDGDAQRIPTKENQFIWVDTTARWKITDPLKFYESVTTIQQAYSRLDDVIDSSVRTVISDSPLAEAVRSTNLIKESEHKVAIEIKADDSASKSVEELLKNTSAIAAFEEIKLGREELSKEMLKAAKKITPEYGIELIDIVIRQIRYSDDLTQSVYNRMIKERKQIAEFYRSYGEGKKAEWLGKLDNEKRSILSSAYERSETVKGTADAVATKIYSDAYGQDKDFFEFWRSIESYKKTLPKFSKTLSTNMDYFKFLYNQDGR
ncbi:MAG: protease modulator HflC [Spirochaetes bacterium]|nr:MAG: protease modulator HflC [Spirochaetota bacterium]